MKQVCSRQNSQVDTSLRPINLAPVNEPIHMVQPPPPLSLDLPVGPPSASPTQLFPVGLSHKSPSSAFSIDFQFAPPTASKGSLQKVETKNTLGLTDMIDLSATASDTLGSKAVFAHDKLKSPAKPSVVSGTVQVTIHLDRTSKHSESD